MLRNFAKNGLIIPIYVTFLAQLFHVLGNRRAFSPQNIRYGKFAVAGVLIVLLVVAVSVGTVLGFLS